jgi:probable HAF family extracellular repeat protein
MKSRILLWFTTSSLLAALAIPAQLTAQEEQGSQSNEPHLQRYTVTFLGTLGGTFSQPFGMNNKGEVDGIANLPGDQNHHAFLWRNSVLNDIGTLGGPNSNNDAGCQFGPNERGEVVGGAETSTQAPPGEDFCFFGNNLVCLPFVSRKGVMTPLPTLGGNNGFACGTNNRGQVIGMAENTTPESDCPNILQQAKPVLWEKGEIHELPTFPGDTDGQGVAVNDLGQAVGASGGCQSGPTNALHALLWQNGNLTYLGNLGGTSTGATDINNRGQVVGASDLPGDTTAHAFLWTKSTGMQDLGTLPGDSSSLARGINNKGQVVGQSCDAGGNCRAFLWQNGVMTDLNTLVPGGGSTLFLFEAFAMNPRGQFAAVGFDVISGDCCAFLATPSDGEAASGSASPTPDNQISQNQKAVLPENVRKMLQQRLGFGRLLGPAIRPSADQVQ